MPDPSSRSNRVVEWFKSLVRPVLQRTDSPDSLQELDKLASQVEELGKKRGQLFPICLLGQAGVGKSTLINTLIADSDIVVPSGGGTGPLTASALRVIHGDNPAFVVRYHTKKQVNATRFILEAEIYRQAKNDTATAELQKDEDPEIASLDLDLDSEEQKKLRRDEAVGRARLLVAGAQNAERDLPYLADALRKALGQPLRHQAQLLEEDLVRLNQVQDILKLGAKESDLRFESAGNPDFRRRLRDHASGFLAPLIQEMTIQWPSDLLKNALELVDLPGIGIVSDAYASVTSDYLRNRAKAVMLVVDSRGLRRDDAELLKSSGFLNRLLHASDDLTADPVALMVVVVKIDDVAVENWRYDRQANGAALKTRAQHFSDLVESCRGTVAKQLQDYLKQVWEDASEGKRLVMQSILENLKVFPVSAPQYRLHCSQDSDEDKPFLADAAATNVVALRAAISEVTQRCLEEQHRRHEDTHQRFFGLLRSRLEVLSAQGSEEKRADAEINEFKQSLDTFMAPHQREFDTRRGEFRAFLRKTMPAKIEGKVASASETARKAIYGDLSKLQDAHWKTLQAAVRREGTFYGSRHINLPHDFALRFEEPVAEVWSRDILAAVRRETRAFADYESSAVTQVLEWSREQGIRVSTRLLEALVTAVKERRQQVNAVGRDAVDDLRDKVRAELIKEIEAPIRSKCRKFVADNQHFGTGVKDRILQLFSVLAGEVVTVAAGRASAVLVERFKEVDQEILAAFREHGDPLKEAAEALIQRQEKNAQREDAQLAKAIEAALAAMPGLQDKAA